MGTFADSVRANTRKIMRTVNAQCLTIARELFLSIISLTPSPNHPGPYAAGWLANQWYPELGSDFSEELGGDLDAAGGGSITRVEAMLGNAMVFLEQDGSVTLTNNLPYAYRAEAVGWPAHDGYKGDIGPYRMVAKSIQAIVAKYP